MKICAVRLREVGCFVEPVAVEGFSGRLDVLAGRNELGKSTILRALQVLFAHKHTSRGGPVAGLRPYTGGAPLIEVDFEAKNHRWRLRKQFLDEAAATLTDLGTGTVSARGEKAHDAALDLCQSDGGGLFGLLWVEQARSFELPALKKEGQSTLEAALEQEIASVAGSAQIRMIRAKAEAELDAIVSSAHQKPRGDYKVAREARATLDAQKDRLRRAAGDAAHRLEQLSFLRSERTSLVDPEGIAAEQQRIVDLQRSMAEAEEARRRLREAETELKAATSLEAEANRRHRALREGLLELDTLGTAETRGLASLEDARAKVAGLDEGAAGAQAARTSIRSALENARRDLRTRLDADETAQIARRLEEVEAKLLRAQRLAERIAALETRAAGDPATEELWATVERESAAVGHIEARLAAALPKVSVSYAPAAAARFRVDGRMLAHGEVLAPAEPLVIHIDGIGAIRVDPAASEATVSDQARLNRHRAALAACLDQIGAKTPLEAWEARQRRQAVETELRQCRDQLAVWAPVGLARLLAERAELSGHPVKPAAVGLPLRSELELHIGRLADEEVAAEARLEQLRSALSVERERVASLVAAEAERRRRIAELERSLPSAADRPVKLAEAESLATEAREGLNSALRLRAAWAEQTVDDEVVRGLERDLAEAHQTEESRAARLRQVEQDLAVLDSLLEHDRQQELDAHLEKAEVELKAVEDRIEVFEGEIGALKLLIKMLGEVEAKSRTVYVRPLVARLEPLLDRIFPGARVDLDKDIRIARVLRSGCAEAVESLSYGTREQIAVLVRLAFGRLLAETGQPAPVILDDALVYSDDDRMDSLFDELRRAAETHQLIVLTCRTQTFASLGGTRLRLQRWVAAEGPFAEMPARGMQAREPVQ